MRICDETVFGDDDSSPRTVPPGTEPHHDDDEPDVADGAVVRRHRTAAMVGG
eukprot:gene47046-9939_t